MLRWTCRACNTAWEADSTPEECIRCDSALPPMFTDHDAEIGRLRTELAERDAEVRSLRDAFNALQEADTSLKQIATEHQTRTESFAPTLHAGTSRTDGEQTRTDPIAEFVARQEPLPADMRQILEANLSKLYVGDPAKPRSDAEWKAADRKRRINDLAARYAGQIAAAQYQKSWEHMLNTGRGVPREHELECGARSVEMARALAVAVVEAEE